MSLFGSGLAEAGAYKPTEWSAVNAGLPTVTPLFSHPVEHRQGKQVGCGEGGTVEGKDKIIPVLKKR